MIPSPPISATYVSTNVRGDDIFSPGVTGWVSLDGQSDLDSHGEEHWERLYSAFLLYSVLVVHDVVRTGLSYGGPGWSSGSGHKPTAGHVQGARFRLTVGQTL